MTRVYGRVTPADVLRKAGESLPDVPRLLAEMSDAELGPVRTLAERVVRYVDEVVQNRRFQRIWTEAGQQRPVTPGCADDPAGEVWTGSAPSWPTDEHPTPDPVPVAPVVPVVVPGTTEGQAPAAAIMAVAAGPVVPPVTVADNDAERTQIIDVAAIAALDAGQYAPVAEMTAHHPTPGARKPRPVPVPPDVPEGTVDTDVSAPATAPADEGASRGSGDGGTLGAAWDGQDWSALPHDDTDGGDDAGIVDRPRLSLTRKDPA